MFPKSLIKRVVIVFALLASVVVFAGVRFVTQSVAGSGFAVLATGDRNRTDGRVGVSATPEPKIVVPSIVSSPAATFVVDRTDDTNAAAAQVCSGAANDCSLRGAISKANSAAGADTITFDASTNGTPFTLTLANGGGANEDANATGDLDVLDSLTITGNGSGNTIIQAGTTTTNGIDKVFAFSPFCTADLDFSMSGVTVRHGRNTQPFGSADFSYTGGGVDYCGNGTNGTFALSNSIVTANTNTTAYGGGLNVDELAPSRSVITITNTQFTNNTSLMWGGGLNIFGDNGNTTITGSTFSNNHTLGTGGVGGQGGGINIRVTNQNDGDGAATPFVNIDNTSVMNNQAVGFGGGIDVAGAGNQDVTITNTAITGNSLIVTAGGVTNTTGGGFDHSNDPARTTTLTNVLIANNQSTGASGSHGGGLSHGSGILTVRNTTISGNTATGDGGGVYVTIGPSLTLTGATISNNRANSDNVGGGNGGGVRKLAGGGTVTLQNTLVDGNVTGTGSTVDEVNGTVTANFSLIGNTTGATVTGANNQLNVSGRVAALANNGGQTVGPSGFTAVLQTHALLAGSAALENGSNALVPGGISTDQRGTGFTRIVDANDVDTTDEVDIGALEQHPSVDDLLDQTINEDGSLSTSFNVGDANLTSGLDTITITSSNTTLVPNASINVGGTGTNSIANSANSSHSLVITPVSNQFGSTTITITATDLQNGSTQTMTDTFVLTVSPVADLPSVTVATTNEDVQSSGGLVVTRNAVDGAEVSHMKVTNITNGTLFKNNGTTQINNNDFITFAEANAGLKFTPAANLFSPTTTPFGFDVAGATSSLGAGLGVAATASITVNPVADTPSITNATTVHGGQTSLGLVISRNAADSAEVTHFKITNILNGTLFRNDGTTQINNGNFITFAQGNAGLRFTPANNFIGTAHFTIQASVSGLDSGLGGNTVIADIFVNKADTTTGIISSQDPSTYGQAVTFTATVSVSSPGTGTPSGTIDFLDGGIVITGCDDVVLTGMPPQCTTSALTVGNHTITTVYSGDGSFNASNGSMTGNPQVVSQASTTASVTSDAPDPSNVGQSVSVGYSVSVNSPGGGTPGGNVQVSDGVNSCTGTVAAGSCSLSLNTAGNRTLTATYQGDSNYAASPASAGENHLVGTVTWTGASSTNYATGSNWDTGAAPGSGDTVIIPAGATNQPSITTASFSASTLTVASGRTLTVTAPHTLTVTGVLTNNGTIGGTGTIANNFSNAGTVAPGLSPGILNVTGTFATAGNLNMEIGGTAGAGVSPNGHDQLTVSGAATLGGTLTATLTNGFTPATGQSFVIVDAASSTGTFATVSLPSIAPNTWNVQYNNVAGTVTLVVNPPTAAGVSVSGRLLTADGRGIRGGVIVITDQNGLSRTTTPSSLGAYRFDDVESGQTYVITVRSRRFTFTPKVISVNDNLSDVDLIADN